jgi:Phosphodiester glycosidase
VIRFVVLCLLLAFSSAFATPITFAGLPLEPALDSRVDLKPGLDFVPISSLERFGVSVLQSSLSAQLRLRRTGLVLEYLPTKGWLAQNDVLTYLEAPIMLEKQVYVPVQTLTELGFTLTPPSDPNLISINFQSDQDTPFVPEGGFVQILDARASRGRASRVAIDVSKAELSSLEQVSSSLVRIHLENTFLSFPKLIPVGGESLSRVRLVPDGLNTMLELEVSKHATVQLSSLANPDRVVIDVVIPEAPMPTPGIVPTGITYTVADKLHLVTLESGKYKPQVVSAGSGGGKTALEYAEDANAVVAVNGGYYDVAQSLSVDLVLINNQILSYARGNRATLGLLTDDLFGTRAVWGTPKVRLALNLNGKTWNVNTARVSPHPQWVTYFIGDGFVPTGGLGFVTLVLQEGKILELHDESFIAALGQITFSLNPLAFPGFSANVNDTITVSTSWSDPLFSNVQDILAAGPKLVTNSLYAVNATLEGFDTTKEIWRKTKQVAIGLDQQNNWVVAFLESGTPEEFATALVIAKLKEAMRLDSGGSAQVFLAGGMLPNSASRAVPNAIVFVPR